MEQSGKPAISRTDYWRARAALHLVEGSRNDAYVAWEKGAELARALPGAGAYDFERWCFEELRKAIGTDSETGLATLSGVVGLSAGVDAPSAGR